MMNVYKVIVAYIKGGIDKVLTIKRSINSDTANIKVDGRAEAQLIQLACSKAPEGRNRWTLNLLVEKSKVILDTPVSRSTIGRVLKNKLQPHLNDYWCIPLTQNAEFVACMEDVLDIYSRPYDPLCAWTKSHVNCLGNQGILFRTPKRLSW